jgi:hypothetical protein
MAIIGFSDVNSYMVAIVTIIYNGHTLSIFTAEVNLRL